MRKGDAVRVHLINGEKVDMRVWEMVASSSVLVCKPKAYEAALKSGRTPNTVEYRTWAVEPA